MKKYTELELRSILEKHSLWLAGDPNGERADLSGSDLREVDLRGANLSWADLCWADLYGANLYGADLYGANIIMSDLRGAILCRSDLTRANISGADLTEADLRGADLYGADLNGAILCRANLCEAKHINCPMACPEKGSFIGFKKVCGDLIVELEITADALRSSATGRKCRCSKAKVLSITNIDGTESDIDSARSLWDPDFVYTVGETIEVSNFDTNRWNECAPGIHFFISRQEAVDFNI